MTRSVVTSEQTNAWLRIKDAASAMLALNGWYESVADQSGLGVLWVKDYGRKYIDVDLRRCVVRLHDMPLTAFEWSLSLEGIAAAIAKEQGHDV